MDTGDDRPLDVNACQPVPHAAPIDHFRQSALLPCESAFAAVKSVTCDRPWPVTPVRMTTKTLRGLKISPEQKKPRGSGRAPGRPPAGFPGKTEGNRWH